MAFIPPQIIRGHPPKYQTLPRLTVVLWKCQAFWAISHHAVITDGVIELHEYFTFIDETLSLWAKTVYKCNKKYSPVDLFLPDYFRQQAVPALNGDILAPGEEICRITYQNRTIVLQSNDKLQTAAHSINSISERGERLTYDHSQ